MPAVDNPTITHARGSGKKRKPKPPPKPVRDAIAAGEHAAAVAIHASHAPTRKKARKIVHRELPSTFSERVAKLQKTFDQPLRTYTGERYSQDPATGRAVIESQGLVKKGEQFHGDETAGQKVVEFITGVDPRSNKAGSIANTALNAAMILAPEARAPKVLTEALKGSKVGKAVEAVSKSRAAVKEGKAATQTASDAARTAKAERVAARGTRPAKASAKARRASKAIRTGARGTKAGSKKLVRRAVVPPRAKHVEGHLNVAPVAAIANLPAAHQIAAAGQGTAEALNPTDGSLGKTLKTTAQAAPGLFTAPIGIASNLGVSAGRAVKTGLHDIGVPVQGYSSSEITDPAKGVANSLIDFNKGLAETYLSGDAERIKNATTDTYGLTPEIMGLLATRPLTRELTGRATTKVRRTAEEIRAKRGTQRRPPTETPQHVFAFNERRAQRVHEAERAAEASTKKQQLQGETTRRVGKQVRKIKGRQGRKAAEKGQLFPEDFGTFAAERRIPLNDRKAALAELHHIRHRLADDSPNARLVDEFIARFDELAKDEHLHGQVRAMVENDRVFRTLRDKPEDARALYQPIAETHDVTMPEHRPPVLPEGTHTAATTKAELEAEVAAQRSAHEDLKKRIKLLQNEARGVREGLKVREVHGPTRARDAARQRLLDLEANIRGLRAERDHIAQDTVTKHRALTHQLTPQEAAEALSEAGVKPGTPEARDILSAARVRKAHNEHMKVHLPAFVKDVEKVIKERGLTSEGAWLAHRRHDNPDVGEMNISRSYTGGLIPPKEKFREGKLLRQGNVDYSFATYVNESIMRRAASHVVRGHVEDFLPERIKIDGRSVFSGPEVRKLEDAKVLDPKHNTLFPVQEFNRVLADGKYEEALGLIDQSLKGEIRRSADSPGKKYSIFPTESLEELKAQLGAGGRGEGLLHQTRKLSRFSNRAILGTSPAWMVSQFPAEGIMAASAHPAEFFRSINQWRQLPKEQRDAVLGSVEGATGGGLIPETQLIATPRTVREQSNAYKALDRTTAGRWLKGFASAEPLIWIDRWKGSHLRGIAALSHMNHEIDPFLGSLGGLFKEQRRDIEAMRGLTKEEQIQTYYLDHPERMKRVADYVRNVMGSWQALTRHERSWGPFVAFYPFFRFSLRTVYRTFPKEHPIKAAILWNLATSNTVALRQLLGGEPNLLSFANYPLYTGEGGTPGSLLPLSRITPGLNVLVQAGFDPRTEDAGAFLKVLAPWISGPALALTSHDPVSGAPIPQDDVHPTTLIGQMAMAGTALLALPTLARMTDAIIHPGEPRGKSSVPVIGSRNGGFISRLFAKIQSPGQNVRSYVFPFLPVDVERQRDIAKLSELLPIAYGGPDHSTVQYETDPKVQDALQKKSEAASKAWDQINALAQKYGIEDKADQRKAKRDSSKASSRYYTKYVNQDSAPAPTGGSPFGSGSGASPFGTGSGASPFGSGSQASPFG